MIISSSYYYYGISLTGDPGGDIDISSYFNYIKSGLYSSLSNNMLLNT